MSYDLTFEIAPTLYRRAVTMPLDGVPTARLIVPDEAPPEGVRKADFIAQLDVWRTT